MAVTTKDIARIAKVSQSTVSRCLNNSPLISEKTRQRVLKIANDLQFEFNASARSLSTNKTNTIGIIYPDDYMEFGVNLYFGSLHTQIREMLEKKNIDLIVAFKENRYTKTDTIRRLVSQKKVDALIIAISELEQESVEFLANSSIPYIFLHFYQQVPSLKSINQIYADHLYGGYIATEHLISLNHKKIVCLTSSDGHEYHLRRQGFKKALEKNNLKYSDNLFIYGDRSFESGYEIGYKEIDKIKEYTAIFVHTDMMAFGLIEALKEQNIKIPEDISVVGYDDIELANYFRPNLTTVHQPKEEIALLGTERLLELIESENKEKSKEVVVKPTLVIRKSTKEI